MNAEVMASVVLMAVLALGAICVAVMILVIIATIVKVADDKFDKRVLYALLLATLGAAAVYAWVSYYIVTGL